MLLVLELAALRRGRCYVIDVAGYPMSESIEMVVIPGNGRWRQSSL